MYPVCISVGDRPPDRPPHPYPIPVVAPSKTKDRGSVKRLLIEFIHDTFVAVGTRLTLFARAHRRNSGGMWALRLS